jgi:hypothetical protein
MELPHETKETLRASLANRSDSRAAELYAHENQHFQDLIGTVWGQDYLDLLFQAYDTILRPDSGERAYPILLRLFDADRAILFPSYYKYVMPGAPHGTATDRWRMSFSTGARVQPDGRTDEGSPILFVRFDKGDEHVARQPITVGALLEMRALGVEFGAFARWNQTRPADEAKVSEAIRTRETLAFLYDPSMTTYSVASHVAANALGDSDMIAMTDAGFKVADIALNLTANAFNGLVHPSALGANLSRQRLRGFRAQRDRGYAFTTLLFHLRGLVTDLASETAIQTALARAGLRPLDNLLKQARAVIERKRKAELMSPELRAIRELLVDAGLTVLLRRDFDALRTWPAPLNAPGPLVLTGEDGAEFHVGTPALSAEQTYFLHHCYDRLREQTKLALRAARGFEFHWTDYVY